MMQVIHPASAPQPYLVVSSESGGNSVANDQGIPMAGQGSPSVNATVDPDRMDNLPLPEVPAPHPAVWRPDHQPHQDHANTTSPAWTLTDHCNFGQGDEMWTEL